VSIGEGDTKEHLAKYLPPYMLLNYSMRIDEFSYTINGKLNKDFLIEN